MTSVQNRLLTVVLLGSCVSLSPLATEAEELIPIDPLWKSESFRKAFTASYGVDSRIEPKVTTEEKAVLEAVAKEMAEEDREGAAAKLTGSSLTNNSAALIFALGNIRFEEGKIENAVENFSKAIELYPNFRDAHRNLAVAEVQRSQYEKAEPHLVRALELGARDGLTMGLLGYCHASADRHQAALQAYRLAQLTMPEEIQWKLGEAGALLALEDLQAAGSIYETVLEKQPGMAAIWINLADVKMRLGNPSEAITNLEVARRLDGLDLEEIVSLGHLYLNESLLAPAEECYREAIEADTPVSFSKAVDAAENLSRFRHWENAKAVTDKILAIPTYQATLQATDKENEADRRRLIRVQALLELEIGEASKGAELVSELLESNPLDGHALILLAKFKNSQEAPEEAEMLLEQAARIPDFEAEANRELGGLLAESGNYEGALVPLRKAYDLQPDSVLAEYIKTVENLASK